jgi:hypothetical protein
MNDHAIVLAPLDRQKAGMLTGSFSVPGVLGELSHGIFLDEWGKPRAVPVACL